MAHDAGLPPRRKHGEPLVHHAVEIVVVFRRLPDLVDLRVQPAGIRPALGPGQGVQPGHQERDEGIGRIDLAEDIGVRQIEGIGVLQSALGDQHRDRRGRLLQEAPAEVPAVLPVLAGLADQRPEQVQAALPLAAFAFQRNGDQVRSGALHAKQRNAAPLRHVAGGADSALVAQLVQTNPDRIVSRHDRAFHCSKFAAAGPLHACNLARYALGLKTVRRDLPDRPRDRLEAAHAGTPPALRRPRTRRSPCRDRTRRPSAGIPHGAATAYPQARGVKARSGRGDGPGPERAPAPHPSHSGARR